MSVDSTLTMWQGAHTLANVGQPHNIKYPKHWLNHLCLCWCLEFMSVYVCVFKVSPNYICKLIKCQDLQPTAFVNEKRPTESIKLTPNKKETPLRT